MDFVLGKGAVFEPELHVFAHRQVGEDRVILEHHADVALGRVQVVDAGAVKIEIPALDGVEAGDHAQQGRLAAAGRPKKGKKFPAADVQVQVLDNGIAAVFLHGVLDPDFYAHAVSSSLHHSRQLLPQFGLIIPPFRQNVYHIFHNSQVHP